jgi:electron transfer flavoprotein alpha subunit
MLIGAGVAEQAEVLYQAGADAVRVADHASLAPFAFETHFQVLVELFRAEQPEVVLLGATDAGRGLAPRLAHALDGGLIENVIAVSLDETTRAVQATFPLYGGQYFEIAACPEARPQFLTIQPGAFGAPFLDPNRRGEPALVEVEPAQPGARVVGPAEGFAPPEVPLSKASLVVAVGRQVGSFDLAKRLATKLGARLAGDRGARDAEWIGAEQIIDVRGITVAPDIYVSVGIRGDTFHNAAVEGAQFIIAIHPDPGAPIFEIADLCCEADPKEVLPHLLEALEAS